MTNEIFREKMKIFLKSKKITQKALAEQLGVKSFQVNNIISSDNVRKKRGDVKETALLITSKAVYGKHY